LAQDVCEESEPELVVTDGPEHLAACHFHESLVGASATQLFGTTSADPDLVEPAEQEVAQ
jgi:peptide/nickel transport system ATP-binding protein